MKKHIVLIGLNYQPHRSTGDKNFWVELVPLLARGLDRLSILSIREHPQKQEEIEMGNCQVFIKYFSPRFLETPDAHYSASRIFWKEGAFPSWLGVIEKQMNIRRVVIELRSIYKVFPFSHIHLMDNFGFGNRTIFKAGSRMNATTSVSAMAYQGKNPFLYHPYLWLSYCATNLCIIPFSLAFKKKLSEIGISQKRIRHIPWGISIPNDDFLSKNRNFSKKILSIPDERPLFLWAGYIQQIQKSDFFFALKQAKNAIKKGIEAIFYFAFKPESMEKGFKRFHKPEQGIYVVATGVEQFNHLKFAADIFYSPVTNRRCILAPPLTWIEMMSLGVPILTTNVHGAFEIVEEGETGCLAHNEDDLMEKMFLLKESAATMKIACRKKVEEDYNICNIARRYLDFFINRKEGNAI